MAEGAEEGMIDPDDKITKVEKLDGSGNKIFDDIGKFLSKELPKYLLEKHNIKSNLRYIDPTYAIRSVAANGSDTILCSKLAQNAVHGAMTGYTAFSTGAIRSSICYIPVRTIMDAKIKKVSVFQRDFLRYKATSGQPDLVNEKNKLDAEMYVKIEALNVK